jgi:NAD(P)-dependent dehydrogenase (short-subunit alcohol dehydrogenase family)
MVAGVETAPASRGGTPGAGKLPWLGRASNVDSLNQSASSRPATIIAGGSGGIGAAIGQTLARAGFDVTLTYYRSRDKAEGTSREIADTGGRAEIAPVDLNDATTVRAVVDQAAARSDGLAVAVYAAGPYINMRRPDPDGRRRLRRVRDQAHDTASSAR